MIRSSLVVAPLAGAARLAPARVVAGLLLAWGLAACSSTDRSDGNAPPPATPAGVLRAELLKLAGPNARDCGLVPLGQDPGEAWRCAQAADAQGLPYWFALQRQGIDSSVWTAALRTREGERYIVGFDSNTRGGPGLHPRFAREKCADRPSLLPDMPRGLACVHDDR